MADQYESRLYLGENVSSLTLLSKFGRSFKINDQEVSKNIRTSDGTLKKKVRYFRKIFTLAYSRIDGEDLQTFLDLHEENKVLLFRYYHGSTVNDYTDYNVIMGAIEQTRKLLKSVDADGYGLWENVNIVLTEVLYDDQKFEGETWEYNIGCFQTNNYNIGAWLGQGVYNVLNITSDDYFSLTLPAKPEELVNKVNVKTQPVLPVETQEQIFKTGETIKLSAGATYNLIAKYSKQPALLTGITTTLEDAVGGVLGISSETYYSCHAEITIINSSGTYGEANVVIDGYPLELSGEETITSEDADSIRNNGLKLYEYPKNFLVQSPEIAQLIADNLLASYKTFRKDVSIRWRGNPAVELADTTTVPVYEDDTNIYTDDFKITKNTHEYNGAYQMTTDGRKI